MIFNELYDFLYNSFELIHFHYGCENFGSFYSVVLWFIYKFRVKFKMKFEMKFEMKFYLNPKRIFKF